MSKNKKWVYLAGISALLAAGCAKEKPFETVYKGQNKIFAKTEAISKATGYQAIPCTDPNDPCLYVPTAGQSSRNVDLGNIPYHTGISKVVSFKIDDGEIRIVDMEKEAQFRDNAANDALALSIPVTHKDYRCREDANGDCANVEEEVDDMEDRDKRFVEVDFEGMKVHEINSFDAMNASLFGCASEIGSRLKKVKIDNGALNLTVERDFKIGIVCLGAVEDPFRDSTFTEEYSYSFVPLSKIASPDYKPIAYTDADEDKFGFFKTQMSNLSVDNMDIYQNYKHFLNRWNPNKKEVVYYLNKDFYKKENKSILHATEVAVNNMNTILSQNKVKLRIKIEDGRNKDQGDLRNSFINLIEDPIQMSLLGYGPSVKNPFTGEIVSATANMYLGIFKQVVGEAYRELVKKQGTQPVADNDADNGVGVQDDSNTDTGSDVDASLVANQFKQLGMQKEKKIKTMASLINKLRAKSEFTNGLTTAQSFEQMPSIRSNRFSNLLSDGVDLESLTSAKDIVKTFGLSKDMVFKNNKYTFEDPEGLRKLDYYSTNNAYHAEFLNAEGIMSGILSSDALDAFKVDGKLVAWENLSQKQRKDVINIVVPYLWVPTLVHELGHTLGLRHNFFGSVDQDNWYTKEELASVDIKSQVPLSTVMDYPGTNVTELPILGKYDIAALRFAYNRQVETEDGNLVDIIDEVDGKPVKSPMTVTLKDLGDKKLKEFMYCSDEHVSGSPLCNRHDLGTNLVEIAQYYVEKYKDRYDRANFRGDRTDFSVYQDMGYAGGVDYYMFTLRSFFEFYENIKLGNGLTDERIDELIAQGNTFVKELKDSMMISADFLIDQLATPDRHCVVLDMQAQGGPSPILLPIDNISDNVSSCFDIELNDRYKMFAETGKHINNKKDTNATHHNTSYVDQIDVRGTWIDKVFAMKYLTKRKLGSIFDRYTGNYLDIPAVRAKVVKKLQEFMMGEVTANVEFTDAEGKVLENLPKKLAFSMTDTHKVHGSLSSRVNKYFGLRKGNNNNLLTSLIFGQLTENIVTEQDLVNSEMLLNAFEVYKAHPLSSTISQAALKVKVGPYYYVATEDNIFAQELIMMLRINSVLDKVDDEVIAKIIAAKKAGRTITFGDSVTPATPADILNQGDDITADGAADVDELSVPDTAEVRAAAKMEVEVLEVYAKGEIPSTNHLVNMLESLRIK